MKVVFGIVITPFAPTNNKIEHTLNNSKKYIHTAVLNPVCSVAELPVNKSFHQRPAYSRTRSHCHVNLFTSFNVVIFDL